MRPQIPNMQRNFPDPFGSMRGMVGQLQQFTSNPMQFMLNKRMNIPDNMQNATPADITQYLLNSGQITQEQLNWANNMARKIQDNPQFQQMIGGR